MIIITKKTPAYMLNVSESAVHVPSHQLSHRPQAAAVGIKFNIQYESTLKHVQQIFHSCFKEIHMYFRQAKQQLDSHGFLLAVHGTCDIANELSGKSKKVIFITSLSLHWMEDNA